MSSARRLSFKEDAELAIGATGAVVATDQVAKSMDPDDNDQLEHLLKAGVGAAVAIGAYELLRRAELGSGNSAGERRHSSSSSHSRRDSNSSNPPQHKRHLFEEAIGAYTLGKELLGDKKHHVAHLVGEAIGATGLLQELRERERDKSIEERGSRRGA
jgi:hypothetical protein